MAFLLNSDTTLMCPHGGPVNWVSSTSTTYRVAGSPPLLMTDFYAVTGCHYMMGQSPNPCIRIDWTTGSQLLTVMGKRVLTNTSVGMCVSANGMYLGSAVIASHQRVEMEPTTLTTIWN